MVGTLILKGDIMAKTVFNSIEISGLGFVSKDTQDGSLVHLSGIDHIEMGDENTHIYKDVDNCPHLFNITTHDEVFHPDEVVAIALLDLFGFQYNLVRTRSPKKIERSDITIDVGEVCSPRDGHFDHHQFKKGDANLGKSSAGLVFNWLTKEAPEKVASFIASVDARDTHTGEVDPRWEELLQAVTDSNLLDVGGKAQDERFALVVFLVKGVLRDLFDDKDPRGAKIQLLLLAEESSREKEAIFAKRREEAFYLDGILYGEFFPEWREDVTPENPLFILRDKKGIKAMVNTDFCRIVDIEDKVFVHPNGFVGASTKTSPEVKVSIGGEERTIKVQYSKGFQILVDRKNHMGVHSSYVEVSEDGYPSSMIVKFPKDGGVRMEPESPFAAINPTSCFWE